MHTSKSKSFSANQNIATGFLSAPQRGKKARMQVFQKVLVSFSQRIQRLQKQRVGDRLGDLDRHQPLWLKRTLTSWLLWADYCPLPFCLSRGLGLCEAGNSARSHAGDEETGAFPNKRRGDFNYWQISISQRIFSGT